MTEHASDLFIVSLNSNKVLEYYRERGLTKNQSADLNKMDTKLDHGINISGKYIESPNPQEKAVFIANQLVLALQSDNESILALTSAYLATRYPELKQLKVTTHEGKTSIELINDKEFIEQTPISFVPRKDLT